ncbi:DUF2158 domain-containing protein [Bradyrhizobium prioriisuperbiae]|uniref:DUF2158 domain-containing protein n=1 Tax=Bradyrhizobium prioriisuperbiae TaxID=2854389 RepID=UPI0028ED4AA6|nr:DUF2158 domain-containing protein [Bradyrhizobium prioritasuperba]
MKVGDVVRLKSGGAAMTIVVAGEKVVECCWFDIENHLHRETFKVANLVLA